MFASSPRGRVPAWRLLGAVALLGALSADCGAGVAPPPAAASPGEWVEEEVSFQAAGMTVYGTYRRPARPPAGRGLPAVLLVAGSGPTDRDGNTPLVQGRLDSLKAVAGWLSEDGVASLRYDKLDSGRTGAGRYGGPGAEAIGLAPFEQQAAAALGHLAARPGVDRARLGVIGHSEGALFALLLAAGRIAGAAPVHAAGLLEPLADRYLDVIGRQFDAQVAAGLKGGTVSEGKAAELRRAYAEAVRSLRASGTLPPEVPRELAAVFNPGTARFLAEADRHDPARLAAALKPGTPVLVSCSDADIQVSCADVTRLTAGLAEARAATRLVRLSGVSHVLKEDPSRTPDGYGRPLPFSAELRRALHRFTATALPPR
ncbi:alpha/beta hydrolase [Actinomadura sp. ATCC 31491]|uniref:Alpha/beta hydrolase n=1 Tax=Actinomadura luzonensis TaxID=2805427 RepID=A0ABT0G394_9ACTN|nr:alpha/beta hydrolase [Actinomadura luzonensis]MCK2218655.1 alpha/beta hydrolase [Actinomadura luzonensis]